MLLGVSNDVVEDAELLPAGPGDGNDVAAPIVRVDGASDKAPGSEFIEGSSDVAAVHVCAAAEVRLAGRAPFVEGCEQAVVVAAQAGGPGLESIVE